MMCVIRAFICSLINIFFVHLFIHSFHFYTFVSCRVILTPEREATLQQMVDEGKLSWEGNPNLTNLDEEAWYRHYAALLEWGKENGHCNIPVRAVYECEIPEMVDTHGRYNTVYNV